MIEIGEDFGSYRVIEILDNDIIGYCEGNIQPYVLWKFDMLDDVKDALYFETYEDVLDAVEMRHLHDPDYKQYQVQ